MSDIDNMGKFFEAIPIPSIILLPDTPHFTITSVNGEFLKIAGARKDDLLKHSFFKAFGIDKSNSEGMTKLRNSLKKVITTRELDEIDAGKFNVPASGEFKARYWSSRNVPVLSENGKVSFIIHFAQKISEEAPFQIEKYRNKTYRLAKIGGWVLDVDTGNQHWSPVVKDIYEVPDSYQPNLEFSLDFYKGKQREAIKKAVNDAVEKGESYALEVKATTAKGNERWVRVVGEPEMRAGKCIRIYGSTQDIDKYKKAEQKLHDIVEHSTIMFYRHTADHVLTYVSPQSKEFLGYEPVESMKRWTKFVTDHPINRAGLNITQQAIDTGKAQTPHELELMKKDGEKIWVSVNEAPVIKDGKTVAIVGSLSDITERKRHEEKLRELSLVASKTTDVIVITDSGENISWVNDAFEKLTGYSFEESVGENINNLLRGPKTDIDTLKRIRKAIQEGKPIQAVILNYAKDGNTYWVDITVDPIFDEEGNCTKIIEVQKDVTEQKKQEKVISEALKEKETLLAEIHHRVKNNLAVVAGMMQLQAFEEQNQSLTNKLLDSVSRISSMATIHEQLYQSNSFSKLNFSENLQNLATTIVNTIQTTTEVELKFKLEAMELSVNQAIPCSLIVNEVVTNILKHAFKDKEKGCISFKLSENDGQIFLSIKDNGIGLPSDFMTVIYEKSLGLNLINTLANQLQSEYNYESNGEGTVFNLQFKRSELRGIGSNIA